VKRWRPGDEIEMREVWDGRTWEVRCGFVIEDTPDVVALYTPPSAPAITAVAPDGKRLRLPPPEWAMAEVTVPPNRRFVAVHPWGEEHSVLVIFDGEWKQVCWYINLESNSRRTPLGLEYEEHVLDVVVQPDLSSWRWKDEDEMAEAVQRGLFTEEQAAQYRSDGERALEWLLARRPPYDRPWEEWRPPDGWGSPRLPGSDPA
jgi:hypothetical protein